MARSVFFSFDYDDVWRANQVRKSGTFAGVKRSGFKDEAEFEQVKRRGDNAIEKWIQRQMHGCSVTCVLIGRNTHKSKWVKFEIKESIDNGMGLLGVYIHLLRDMNSSTLSLSKPPNPLDNHTMRPNSNTANRLLGPNKASEQFETYIWQPSNPLFSILAEQNDLGAWVEEAARRAGR